MLGHVNLAEGEQQPVRVVLAEDGVLLREGLVGLLDRFGFDVVAAVEDAVGLLAAVGEHRPDLVITDVRMPPGFSDEGIRAAVQLRGEHPALPVVLLSQYVERAGATELLGSPGSAGLAYLLKDRVVDVGSFVAALRRVLAGETLIDPDVVRQLLRRDDPLAPLTPREREVLGLMAQGHSNGAIAAELVVTGAAVDKHVSNVLAKLGLPPDDDHNRRVLAVLTYLGSS